MVPWPTQWKAALLATFGDKIPGSAVMVVGCKYDGMEKRAEKADRPVPGAMSDKQNDYVLAFLRTFCVMSACPCCVTLRLPGATRGCVHTGCAVQVGTASCLPPRRQAPTASSCCSTCSIVMTRNGACVYVCLCLCVLCCVVLCCRTAPPLLLWEFDSPFSVFGFPSLHVLLVCDCVRVYRVFAGLGPRPPRT